MIDYDRISQYTGCRIHRKDTVIMIGKRIRDLRTSKGITQEALSKALGVSSQAVSKWEQNITSPDISLLVPIADYFGVSLDVLLREKPKVLQTPPEEMVKVRAEKHGRHWRFHIKNISDYVLSRVCVKVLFYDSANEVVDHKNCDVYDLDPNCSRPELLISNMDDCVERIVVKPISYKIAHQ